MFFSCYFGSPGVEMLSFDVAFVSAIVRNRPEVFATVCKCPQFFASEYREGIKFISCGRHGGRGIS